MLIKYKIDNLLNAKNTPFIIIKFFLYTTINFISILFKNLWVSVFFKTNCLWFYEIFQIYKQEAKSEVSLYVSMDLTFSCYSIYLFHYLLKLLKDI